MRKIWLFLILIMVVVLIIVVSVYYFIFNIDYDFRIKSVNLKDITLSDILSNLSTSFTVDLDVDITNKNILPITIDRLSVYIKYKGSLISKTKEPSSAILIKKGHKSTFSQTYSIIIDKNTIPIVKDMLKKKPVKFQYEVSFMLFGMKLTEKGDYLYN